MEVKDKLLTGKALEYVKNNFPFLGKEYDTQNKALMLKGGIIDWGFIQLISKEVDAEVSINFTKNVDDRILNLGVPSEDQLPNCSKKLCIYDATNAYGLGNRWIALATENYVDNKTHLASVEEVEALFNGGGLNFLKKYLHSFFLVLRKEWKYGKTIRY